jgi:hypothetical protein
LGLLLEERRAELAPLLGRFLRLGDEVVVHEFSFVVGCGMAEVRDTLIVGPGPPRWDFNTMGHPASRRGLAGFAARQTGAFGAVTCWASKAGCTSSSPSVGGGLEVRFSGGGGALFKLPRHRLTSA